MMQASRSKLGNLCKAAGKKRALFPFGSPYVQGAEVTGDAGGSIQRRDP